MKRQTLTYEEALLLQRHIDGESSASEEKLVGELLQESSAARIFVASLKELRAIAQMAEEFAWEQARVPSAEEVVELAFASTDWVDTSLEELAPLLERFHDGETDPAERAVVAALIDERDDVAQYLAELDGIARGIRQAGELDDVDFGGFWDSIEDRLDDDEVDDEEQVVEQLFDVEKHQVLLYRFHDGEVSDEESRRVTDWLEGGHEHTDGVLGALAEIHLGVNAGIEFAQESADLDEIWTAVESRLDEIDAEKAAGNVVSLDRAPSAGREKRASDRRNWTTPVFALVAALLLMLFGGLFGSEFFQNEHVVEQIVETRTVVIFDSVEYAPGSSVMIHTPELANHDGSQGDDIPILWVIDEDEPGDTDSDSQDDLRELPGPI